MNERDEEFLDFYRECRIHDQLGFYSQRRRLLDDGAGQSMAVSAVLLGFATAAGALAGTTVGPTAVWSVLATVLPAASTALAAYTTLYAFEQQSKIYGDAVRAARAAARSSTGTDAAAADLDVADLVKRVEAVFRQEQAQWGQLTSQIEIPDNTRT
jgi:SMODS and SLOG-associating 2TM effector domain 1